MVLSVLEILNEITVCSSQVERVWDLLNLSEFLSFLLFLIVFQNRLLNRLSDITAFTIKNRFF